MQLDKIILFGKDLANVDPVFAGVRPKYSKQVIVNFTDGKTNDQRWANEKKSVLGLTNPNDVHVDEHSTSCSANVLIDLYEMLSLSLMPAMKTGHNQYPAKLSPLGFRRLAVMTVVHELFHVYQGWQIGRRFGRDIIEEKYISLPNRTKEYADANPDTMENDEYLQNVFESGARNAVVRWEQAHGKEIHQGSFDFLLPMVTMLGFFPNEPDAFLDKYGN